MNKGHILTEQQQELAVQLATFVANGSVRCEHVLEHFSKDLLVSKLIMNFWAIHNDITKVALKKVVTEKFRQHLQKCWHTNCEGYPDMEC